MTSAKESKRLQDILAIPRISRNVSLYLPEELTRADGKTIPVLWNHQGSPKDAGQPVNQWYVIGTTSFSRDPADMTEIILG